MVQAELKARFAPVNKAIARMDERLGVIAEDELDRGQTFRNPYEETKFQAEKIVQRAAATLPVTIFRPCSVVGDSRTGEIDRFEGPYYLGILLVTSPMVVPRTWRRISSQRSGSAAAQTPRRIQRTLISSPVIAQAAGTLPEATWPWIMFAASAIAEAMRK